MSEIRPLKVCLDARLRSGSSGGVETVVIGLASGLSSLADGDEEYLFLAWQGEDAWLRPYLGRNCRILDAGPAPAVGGPAAPAWVKAAWHRLSPLFGRRAVKIAVSDGRAEASGAELMHFTKQDAFLTKLPSIYHPHDLQHLHLPGFFTPRQLQQREILYQRFCAEAAMVAIASDWGRQDLLKNFGLDQSKVADIPLAPIPGAYPVPSGEDLSRVRRERHLPEAFFFYPAQTWPHKNHQMLLEAAAKLEAQEGLKMEFVFSGQETAYAESIRTAARRLGLLERVHMLGFVSPLELVCLYRLSRAVVIPTLFEAASGPLWEAFQLGVPAAVSNVTSLPRQAGDAALVFDPRDLASVSDALKRLWTDEGLRNDLAARGPAQAAKFSWGLTARIFRAHYRRLAGRQLGADDLAVLAQEPLL